MKQWVIIPYFINSISSQLFGFKTKGDLSTYYDARHGARESWDQLLYTLVAVSVVGQIPVQSHSRAGKMQISDS
jgi:hypothetical protein